LPVKIGKNSKIGNNNAIGENANVNVTRSNKGKKENKKWFVEHPWLSAIICSLIAGIIMLLNWSEVFTIIKGLFSN
jgi:hypothetical protein